MELSSNSTFKFPFTDNEETDLNLSASFQAMRGIESHPTVSRDDKSDSPLDLAVELSPITRRRNSDTSTISYAGSVEGQRSVLDALSPQNEGTKSSEVPTRRLLNHDERTFVETIEAQNTEGLPLTSKFSNKSSSLTTDTIQSAVKQVGERSSNFIDKIRDAAHKRKVAVTRSRDFLVAKEQEQLRSIAECKTRFAEMNQRLQNLDEKNNEPTKENDTPRQNQKFESSSSKNNRGAYKNGFGGLGVPKVEKRPTTTPLSPKLGLRRKEEALVSKAFEQPQNLSKNIRMQSGQRNRRRRNTVKQSVQKNIDALESKYSEETSTGVNGVFRARRAPPSSTRRWNAGQIGIRKVSKRAVTVPVSPCLGPKRQSRVIVECCNKTDSGNSKSKPKGNAFELSSGFPIVSRSKVQSPSSERSSPLLGLNLIDSTRKKELREQKPHSNNFSLPRIIFKPFVPRSTHRSNIRRQYNNFMIKKQALGLQEKREKLQSQIKDINRELKILSKDLT